MFKITVLRKNRGLTQAQLGKCANIDPVTVSRLESGVMKPYPAWQMRLAAALGVEPDMLFEEVEIYEKNDTNRK